MPCPVGADERSDHADDLRGPRSARSAGDFEDAVGDQLATAIEAGEVRVEYRIVSFLDGASPNAYSSRAANALMAVQDTAGPEAFAALHDTLFANQPEEGTAGPTTNSWWRGRSRPAPPRRTCDR